MRDAYPVRTTLDIDDDVLLAVKEIAIAHGLTAGKVLSGLARKGLEPPKRPTKTRNGVPLLPPRPAGSPPITVEFVNQLLDEE